MAHRGKAAELALGQCIARRRAVIGMSQMDLGKKVNQKQQQIARYEAGDFVPLNVMEAMAEVLDCYAPKRLIRRISFLRKLEKEKETEQEELIPLYQELFSGEAQD